MEPIGPIPTRLKRRGLAAGAAALVAALLGRSGGAERVEAATNDFLKLGNPNDAGAETTLTTTGGFNPVRMLNVTNTSPGNDGMRVTAGSVTSGEVEGGIGIVSFGGSGCTSSGGIGISGVGGSTGLGGCTPVPAAAGGEGVVGSGGSAFGGGTGGVGVRGQGGAGTAGPGGDGMSASGGDGTTAGGHGLRVQGGAGSTGRGGFGVFATGGEGNGVGQQGPAVFGVTHDVQPVIIETNIAVVGKSTNGRGVVGRSGSSNGVEGTSGPGAGVRGQSDTGIGVEGQTNTAANAAVVGTNLATGPGVTGRSGPTGAGSGIGARGLSGSGDGVRGESATGTGVRGTSGGTFTQGVLGEGSGSAHGVTGTSVNAFGLSGTSTNAKGFVGVNTNGNDFAGLFIGHGANANDFTAPGIFVKGRAVITGGVSANALTSQGPRLLHGVQAADDLAEDVGTGVLRGGRAHVELDPLFAETIKTDGYQIFLTPYGDTRGLFVAAKDARGFTVQEAQGGAGSFPFDWRVVAERKGAPPGARLMRAPEPDLRGTLERLPGPPPERPTNEPAPPPPAAPPTERPGRR